MKHPIALLKDANLRVAKFSFVIICALLAYSISGLEVKAQFQPPCVDSTPFCPCVLENGDCFDIDTPIDNDVLILLIGGISLALFKLHLLKLKGLFTRTDI